MADFSQWDFALEFTGKQIAALIVGVDPTKAGAYPERVDPVLRRLDQAYRQGLSRCWGRHSPGVKAAAPEPADSDLSGGFVHVLEDMARKGADELSIQHHIEGLWDRFDEDLFSRAEVVRWLTKTGLQSVYRFDLQSEQPQRTHAPISPREETTYLTIIGAMLELVLGKTPAGKPQSVFESQAAIIEALLAHHGDKRGISKTTLETKFAEARRRLNST